MRLTDSLLKLRNVMPGYRYGGKHKMPIIIRPWTIEAFKKRLQIEERNMFLLRHPYLTRAQEIGHAAALNKKESWMNEKKLLIAARKVQKSVKVEAYLGHLNVTNSWER